LVGTGGKPTPGTVGLAPVARALGVADRPPPALLAALLAADVGAAGGSAGVFAPPPHAASKLTNPTRIRIRFTIKATTSERQVQPGRGYAKRAAPRKAGREVSRQ
jgi:hypothetical protein